jgi:hypothetical protein
MKEGLTLKNAFERFVIRRCAYQGRQTRRKVSEN